MAQWSITPISGGATSTGASIDSVSGTVTFQRHTTESVYRITYTADTISSAVTRDITVYPCLSCSCSFLNSGTITSSAKTSVEIGTYYLSNCSNSSITATFKSGTNFLSSFTFSDGKIKANTAANTNSAATRSCTYTFSVDGCSGDVTFTQNKATPIQPTSYSFTVYSNVNGATVNIGGTNYTITNGKAVHTSTSSSAKNASISKAGYTFNPSTGTVNANSSIRLDGRLTPTPPSCTSCTQVGVTHQYTSKTLQATSGSNVEVGHFTTNCENNSLTVNRSSGSYLLENLRIVKSGRNNYYIYGNYSENTSYNIIIENIAVYVNGVKCGGDITVSQLGKTFCVCGVTAATSVPGTTVTSYPIATYTASCSSNAVVSYIDGAQIIQTPTCVLSGGKIRASVNENPTQALRTGHYALYFDNRQCEEFYITQAAGPCNCNSLSLSATEFNFSRAGGTITLGSIRSGCTFSVAGTSPWVTVFQDGTYVKATATTNTDGIKRSTAFSYYVDGKFCSVIRFTQNT